MIENEQEELYEEYLENICKLNKEYVEKICKNSNIYDKKNYMIHSFKYVVLLYFAKLLTNIDESEWENLIKETSKVALNEAKIITKRIKDKNKNNERT